jgi:hypothetical protein
VIVVPIYIDKNPSEGDHSGPKHVKDNRISTLSITLEGFIKLCGMINKCEAVSGMITGRGDKSTQKIPPINNIFRQNFYMS